MEPESSLPHSQQPATSSHPEQDQYNPRPPDQFPWDPSTQLQSLLRLSWPNNRQGEVPVSSFSSQLGPSPLQQTPCTNPSTQPLTLTINISSNYLPYIVHYIGQQCGFHSVIILISYVSTTVSIYLLTYSMVQSPSWEANWFAASQEIPRILWNSFMTSFTSARHLSLSWASSIQSMPTNSTSWRSILILSSHLRLGLLSGLFPSVFLTKPPYTPLPIRATFPAHLILLDFITLTIMGEEYTSLSSPLCSFLHSPVTSSLLGPNILLNTLFSHTLSLRSSLNVSDQVSHPYKTTGKIMVATH